VSTPEDKARENIDRLLINAGWAVRDQSDTNVLAYRGVAIRNFLLKTPATLSRETYKTYGEQR
jgi:type I restriction enzyme R subunit